MIEGDLEVARLAFDAGNLRVGHDLDIGLPVAFDEFRQLDAHRAVVGRKRLVELGHLAADGRRLLHQIDLEAGGGEIERRLNAADAAADDHHVPAIVVRGT